MIRVVLPYRAAELDQLGLCVTRQPGSTGSPAAQEPFCDRLGLWLCVTSRTSCYTSSKLIDWICFTAVSQQLTSNWTSIQSCSYPIKGKMNIVLGLLSAACRPTASMANARRERSAALLQQPVAHSKSGCPWPLSMGPSAYSLDKLHTGLSQPTCQIPTHAAHPKRHGTSTALLAYQPVPGCARAQASLQYA